MTQTPPGRLERTLADTVEAVSLPLFAFAAVFAVAVVVLGALLNPDRFPVRVGDKIVHLADLKGEEEALNLKMAGLTAEQDRLSGQTPTPVLNRIAGLRRAFVHTGDALQTLETVQKGFALEETQTVFIDHVYVDGVAGTVRVAGEIRNVGSRSMQVLAALVDSLRASKAYVSVSEPEYLQVQRDNQPVSPFTLTLKPHAY